LNSSGLFVLVSISLPSQDRQETRDFVSEANGEHADPDDIVAKARDSGKEEDEVEIKNRR
jgi:hypothetical protein